MTKIRNYAVNRSKIIGAIGIVVCLIQVSILYPKVVGLSDTSYLVGVEGKKSSFLDLDW